MTRLLGWGHDVLPARRLRTSRGGASRRRAGSSGVSMVEFALVAPLFLLVLLGIFVVGLIVMNVIALNNGLRDAARAAAVCGTLTDSGNATATLPDGTTSCSTPNLNAYVNQKLSELHGGATVGSVTVTVVDPTLQTSDPYYLVGSGFGALSKCTAGQDLVKIHAVYSQPLYLPLVGVFFGSNGSTTSRQLDGTAEATCER